MSIISVKRNRKGIIKNEEVLLSKLSSTLLLTGALLHRLTSKIVNKTLTNRLQASRILLFSTSDFALLTPKTYPR